MNHEIKTLRKLAYEYDQASKADRNTQRRTLHRAVNDLNMIRPVVLIEEIPFHELNYDGSLTAVCTDPVLRGAETWLRRQLFKWKHFPADMILPPFFPVHKQIIDSGIGITVEEHTLAVDKTNHIISHDYHDKLSTDEDLDRLTSPVLQYDQVGTMACYEKIANAIGDILPVKIVGHNNYSTIWDNISRYRGVTPLLMDLVERPEFTHRIMEKLTAFEISRTEQMEQLGLFEANPLDIHCTSALNSTLPGEISGDTTVKRSQVWGRGMAQIFASVSKSMHEEFDINYMKKIMEPFGLVYYGCCEPLDNKLDIVMKLPHLRKVGVTPWANVDVATERIGGNYVVANKPNPAAVAGDLDEAAVRAEIPRPLEACKRNDCSCDIVLKDISSANYKVENLVRWERIAMELVESWA